MQDFLNKHPTLVRLVRLRMADWALMTVLLWGVVALLAPQQIPVSVYKMSLVALAAVMGYWVDRSVFPYARPDLFFELTAPGRNAAGETTFTDLGGALSFAEARTALDLQGASNGDLVALARAAMLRRAIIVAAAMLAVSLGA